LIDRVALVLLALLGTAMNLGAAGDLAAPTRQDRVLPNGEGVEKVRSHCALCHGLELVAQQRLSRSDWARVVDQMIEFGAPVSPEDRRAVLEYLTTYLGADRSR
jgi:mono/diheme cytochrome c family protein